MKLIIKTPDKLAMEAAARADRAAKAAARDYLARTDWMVIRAAEGGKPLPEDVRAARADARTRLSV